jgi:hypothetical protein
MNGMLTVYKLYRTSKICIGYLHRSVASGISRSVVMITRRGTVGLSKCVVPRPVLRILANCRCHPFQYIVWFDAFLCQFSSPKSRNQSIILGKRSWTWLADTAGLCIYFLIAHRLFIPTDILNMPRVTNSQTLILPVAEKLELVVLPCTMPTPLFSS